MGIILSGAENLFQELENLKQGIKDKDKRLLGYLFFELANLRDFVEFEKRLAELNEKRGKLEKISGLNSKPPPPALEIDNIRKTLNNVIQNLKDNYEKEIISKKISYSATPWKLPDPPNDQANLFQLFRFYLKKTAEQCIAEAGK